MLPPSWSETVRVRIKVKRTRVRIFIYNFWILSITNMFRYCRHRYKMIKLHKFESRSLILTFIIFFVSTIAAALPLILTNEIIHIGFCFVELHQIDSFWSIPMEKGFLPKKQAKIFTNLFEDRFDWVWIPCKNCRNGMSWRCDITITGLKTIFYPINKTFIISPLLPQKIQLLLCLPRSYLSPENHRSCHVSPFLRLWGS